MTPDAGQEPVVGAGGPKEPVPSAPVALGRLGRTLSRLAGMQGAWPPHRPATMRRVSAAGSTVADGRALADRLADEGVDLVVVEHPGDEAPAAVVLAALLDLEPVAAVGTAGGAGWSGLLSAVRDGLPVARPHLGEPERLCVVLGAPALAGLAGLLAGCAERRTPVLLSGTPAVLAAALLAVRLTPGADAWWLAGATATAPGGSVALAELGLEPLLDLGLTVPGGADLALGLLLAGTDLARA